MKIAIDCRYVRERPSGIGTYVQALVDQLPALAPQDDFLFWTHPRAARPLSRAGNVAEHVVPVEPNSIGPILWPTRYASFEGVDLFHAAHNILPRTIPCPTVVTIHDTFEIEATHLRERSWNNFTKSFYYPRAVWRSLRDATRLIVTTEAMATVVAKLHPPARTRIAIIPLAAGDKFIPASDRQKAQERAAKIIGDDAPFLLVVGQNNRRKQHRMALDAFARGAPSSWRLVLLQRQDRGRGLGRLAQELQIDRRVMWLDAAPTHDVIALYQAARALLQPSLYEGFGLPLLEAMACGCPVIASDLPTLRELAGDAAVLVPPRDVAGFTRAIREVAESRTMHLELSAAARARASNFSWERCARETLEVYRSARCR